MWSKLIQPHSANIIMGKRGAGKSGLAYFLIEKLSNDHSLQPVIVNFPKAELLPSHYRTAELSEIEELDGSIILIDEGTTHLPAGQRKLEEIIKGCQALVRQRNQIILLIFHASSDVGARILRGMDTIMVKLPSNRQIQWGSKDEYCRQLLQDARKRIKAHPEPKKWCFVDCEEPEYRGLLPNGLPSFWSEELSEAWANTSGQVCSKCGKHVDRLIGTVCSECYKRKLTELELQKLDSKIYRRALVKGDISIQEMKDDVLRTDAP